MTRIIGRFAMFTLLAATAAALIAGAQQQQQQQGPPGQPRMVPSAPAVPDAQAPAAPAPAEAPKFPPPDPRNFTADHPTKDDVNSFLQESWGYDENRIWQVAAILKTPVDGLSKVVIYVGDKSGKEKPQAFLFWALPDGKHIVWSDDVFPFGPHPYTGYRTTLQQQADGPYRGSASKDLELVEFADFECPHCKTAQADMDKLAVDFPKARIVFQNYPLERIHPEAKLAAEYGVCVTKMGGSTAFFQFASAVFEGQEGLASADGATLTLNSAVTKVSLDPEKVAACVGNPATSDEVEKSVTLAQDLNINSTPTLVINGRQVPLGNISYDKLKEIIQYQEKLDGVTQ